MTDDAPEIQPLTLEMIRYWNRLRRGDPMPSRIDIAPHEIPHLLPYLTLVDILPTVPRFRHRLIGTSVVEYFGRDLTGHVVDEASYGSSAAHMIAFFEAAAAGKGLRAVWSGRLVKPHTGRFETICLPLGRDRKGADMLLTFTQRLGPARIQDQEPGAPVFMREEPLSEESPFQVLGVTVLTPE